MANIRTYLAELEARLAPSVDGHILRERLTEAENHLRDRAQEFEEVGLPAHEAESRAVAAFGEPEEYAEDLPTPPAVRPVAEKPSPRPRERDLALQLAWSAVGLGLVAMLAVDHAFWVAGGFAVAFIGLGALFGRPTSLLRMAALAAVAALAALPILRGMYEPTPSSLYMPSRLGVRLRGTTGDAEFLYRDALDALRKFDEAKAAYHAAGDLPVISDDSSRRDARFVGPSWSFARFDNWQSRYYPGYDVIQTYDTAAEAERMWKSAGDAARRRLVESVAGTKPVAPNLTPYERDCRFALVAFAGGVGFLAGMAGVQALALAFRAALAWLFGGLRRRPEPPRLYGEPERS